MKQLIFVIKLFLIAFFGCLCLMSYRADFCLFLGSFPAIKNNLYCLKPRKIHIFIDFATMPTLLQMIEFIKLPSQDIKIIAWDRYKNRLPLTKGIQSNVIEWNVPPFQKNDAFIEKELQKMLASFVNPEFYLYLNYKHVGWSGNVILKSVPFVKIKGIHLFEDGMGTYMKSIGNKTASSDKIFQEVLQSIKNYVRAERQGKSIYYSNWLHILPSLYPTYLHVAWHKIPPPRHSEADAD